MQITGELGRRVPPRHLVTVLSLVAGLFFLGVLGTLVGQLTGGSDVPGALLVGIVVAVSALTLLCLSGAVMLARRHVYVSEEAVTVTAGERVVRSVRLDRLTRVRPVVDGSQSAATPEFFARAVVLVGPDDRDRRTAIKLSASTLDMDPVLAVLADEVRRRPDLLGSDQERRLFADYLGAPGSVEG